MNVGAQSYIFPRNKVAQSAAQAEYSDDQAYDFILVNGLSKQPSEKAPWELLDGRFWPEERLLRDFPGSRILLVGNRLAAPLSAADFIGKAEDLQYAIENLQIEAKNPLIFLCHGLGGLLFLQGSTSFTSAIRELTAAVFFFGTPLAATKAKQFKNAILSCAAVECQLPSRNKAVDDDACGKLSNAAKLLQNFDCQIFTLYESKASRKTSRKDIYERIIVTKGITSCKQSIDLALDASHADVTALDESTYKTGLLASIRALAHKPVGPEHRVAHPSPENGKNGQNAASTGPATTEDTQHHVPRIDPTFSEIRDQNTPFPLAMNIQNSTSIVQRQIPLQSPSLPILTTTASDVDGIPTESSSSQYNCQNATETHNSSPINTSNTDQAPLSSFSQGDRHEINITNPEPSQAADLANSLQPISSRSDTSGLKPRYHDFPLIAERSGRVPFCGRAKFLQTIKSSLRLQASGNDAFRLSSAFAIIGPAGQGKTQTALMYASQNRVSFQYILWVTADEKVKLLQAFQGFASAIGLLKAHSVDSLRDVQSLLEWFNTTTASFLLIFDNAEDPALISEFWPKNKSGSIIVTAQNPEFKTANMAGHGQYLESLEHSEALSMMQSGLPQLAWDSSDKKEAYRLLKLIGYHPYAILVIISQVNFAQCSLKAYSKEYKIDTIFDASTSKNNLSRDYNKILSELWSETIKQLDTTSRRLSELLAILDIDNLKEKLLQPCEGLELEVAGYVETPVKSLAELSGLGLIYINEYAQQVGGDSLTAVEEGSAIRAFRMHRLTQVSIIRGMKASPESREIAFASATLLLCAAISPSWDDPRPRLFQQYRDFFTHVNSLHTRFLEGFVEKVPIQFVELLWKASWLCYRKDLANYGLSLIQTGEKILADPKLRLECPSNELAFVTVELENNHACIATELGDFETSLEHFKAALNCYNENTGQDVSKFEDMREYTLYGGVANSLDGLGRHYEAETYYRRCLQLAPASEELSVYEINICRAMLHQQTADKLEEASMGLLGYLRRLKARYGSQDARDYIPGHAYYILGNVRIEQGNLAEAYGFHLKAVNIFNKTLGDQHHKTGDAYHKLGWHLARLHKYDEALEALMKALFIYSGGQGLTYRKREIARTKFKLGSVLCEKGDFEPGEASIIEAKELRKEILCDMWEPSDSEGEFDQLVSFWAR